MENGNNENYEVFNMFKDRWALVAAGDMKNHNACTVGWGSMGTLWSRPGHDGKSVIVYLHPSRYTRQLLQNSKYFTVSFFPDEYKKPWAIWDPTPAETKTKKSVPALRLLKWGNPSVSRRQS